MAWLSVATLSVYGIGWAVYTKWHGTPAEWWGYHEWFHVLVVTAFLANIKGIAYEIEMCSDS